MHRIALVVSLLIAGCGGEVPGGVPLPEPDAASLDSDAGSHPDAARVALDASHPDRPDASAIPLDASVGLDAGCQRQCSGKTCGPDGCGGTCGVCSTGSSCTLAQTCDPTCAWHFKVTDSLHGWSMELDSTNTVAQCEHSLPSGGMGVTVGRTTNIADMILDVGISWNPVPNKLMIPFHHYYLPDTYESPLVTARPFVWRDVQYESDQPKADVHLTTAEFQQSKGGQFSITIGQRTVAGAGSMLEDPKTKETIEILGTIEGIFQ